MVEDDVKLGKDVVIYHPEMVTIYGCQIGDSTAIGPFVEITRGVIIGRNCVIESHSYICTGVVIEDDVFIGHGVMFVNDLFPWPGKKADLLTTTIKKHAILGTGSTIIGGITIGEYSVVGAGAVVKNDIPDLSIAVGNPARVIKTFNSSGYMRSFMIGRQPVKNDNT